MPELTPGLMVRPAGPRPWNRCDTLAILLIPLVVAASKASVLNTLYYWDETLWSRYADVLSHRALWRFVALHHPETFSGHPPGLFLPAAALFRTVGESSAAAHALILFYAAAGVVFTYLLAALWFGRAAGVTAAALLWLTPIYFTQSAMFLADLPVAALGVATVYFAARGARVGYLLCGVYLVLIKETGNVIPLAIAVYEIFIHVGTGRPEALRRGGFFAAPLVVSIAFHGCQWIMTGHVAWIYTNHTPLIDFSAASIGVNFGLVTKWLFLRQRQWLTVGLIGLGALLRPAYRKRREFALLGLIVLLSGYSFVLLSFLPRYVMPVLPHLCVWAGGAITALVQGTVLRTGLIALALVVKGSGTGGIYHGGNNEWNMGYLQQVRVQQEVCRYIEHQRPGARVLCDWPMSILLTEPRLNYISQPLKIICIGDHSQCLPDLSAVSPSGFDLLVDGPVGEYRDALRRYAIDSRLHVIQQFGRGDATAELLEK